MTGGEPWVLVTWMDFDPEGRRTGARLRDAGLRVRLAPKTGAREPAEMARLAGDAVAAIVSTDPFDRERLRRGRATLRGDRPRRRRDRLDRPRRRDARPASSS